MDANNYLNECNPAAKEQFWQEHIKLKQQSSLSRAAYCRKHELSITQFGYWEQKWLSTQQGAELLPVKLHLGKMDIQSQMGCILLTSRPPIIINSATPKSSSFFVHLFLNLVAELISKLYFTPFLVF